MLSKPQDTTTHSNDIKKLFSVPFVIDFELEKRIFEVFEAHLGEQKVCKSRLSQRGIFAGFKAEMGENLSNQSLAQKTVAYKVKWIAVILILSYIVHCIVGN